MAKQLDLGKYIYLFLLRNKTLLLNIFWLKNALILTLTYSAMIPCREVTFLDEAQRKWHNGAILVMEEVKVARDLNDWIAMEVVDNKRVDVVDMIFGIIWAKTFSIRSVPILPIFSRVF